MFDITLDKSIGAHLDDLARILQLAGSPSQAETMALTWANEAAAAGMAADLAMGIASLAVLAAIKSTR